MLYLTRKKAGHGKFYERQNPFLQAWKMVIRRLLERFYESALGGLGYHCVFADNNLAYHQVSLQSEIAPMEDRSSIRFTVTAPEGTSYTLHAENIQIILPIIYTILFRNVILFLHAHRQVATNTHHSRVLA